MANARKCDKCQKCFDPMNETGEMARFRNPIFQHSNEIQENVIGEMLLKNSNPDAICDLCPRCTAMFKLFMWEPETYVAFPNAKPVFDDNLNKINKNACVGYQYKHSSDKAKGLADLVNSMFNLGGDFDGD